MLFAIFCYSFTSYFKNVFILFETNIISSCVHSCNCCCTTTGTRIQNQIARIRICFNKFLDQSNRFLCAMIGCFLSIFSKCPYWLRISFCRVIILPFALTLIRWFFCIYMMCRLWYFSFMTVCHLRIICGWFLIENTDIFMRTQRHLFGI